VDLELGVLQRGRWIGREAAGRIRVARDQEVQPDRDVGVRARLELLRLDERRGEREQRKG
jgi:hypothetical protein